MAIKLTLNISNKAVYTFVAVLILISVGGFAYAYGGTQPSVFGHSADELEIKLECINVVMSEGVLIEIHDLTGNNAGTTLDQVAEITSSTNFIPGLTFNRYAYGIKAKSDWIITGCAANLDDHFSDDTSIYQGICSNTGSNTATTSGTLTAVLCKLG